MNRIKKDPFVWICVAVLLFFCVHFIGKLFDESGTQSLNTAQLNYLAAERTDSVAERKEGFNSSLESFLKIENKYDPSFGNGKLYFDIGNNFFQLEEYPQALLYYYKAEKLRPTDEKVKTHIALAQKKLSLKTNSKSAAFDWLFSFHNHYSLPERLQRLSFLIILTFISLSLYLWVNNRLIYLSTLVLAALTTVLFLSVSYTHFFSPEEGVVIKSSPLYRDAGTHYAKVTPEPLAAGLKVKLQDSTLGGKWIKIETNDEVVGYIPQESLRSITN